MKELQVEYRPPQPRKKDYSIGCIGAGFIMRDCHLVAYKEAGYNVVAITSKKGKSARDAAELHNIPQVYQSAAELSADPEIDIIDVAVPPHIQMEVVEEIICHAVNVRGILLQKPLAMNYKEARKIVKMLKDAGITAAVNQNMRYDQSMRGLKDILNKNLLGRPVLGTIEMRAVPHWMDWQKEYGWLTLRIMSIHHLDIFRYLFGDPTSVFCSATVDPRTTFEHTDGIVLYILEYEDGLRCSAWDDVWTGPVREGAVGDNYIKWRVEGERGLAYGTIGWPSYPDREPSTLNFSSLEIPNYWLAPRWDEVWFPDAFAGPMAELMIALEEGREPDNSVRENLGTMALVDAAYKSIEEKRAVNIDEI